MVLIVLAAVWAAFLLPPILRARAEHRPSGSITDFRRQLHVLARSTPAGGIAPQAIPGRVVPIRPIHSSDTTPASSPETAKEAEMIKFAGTPSIRAMVKWVAAARIAMPSTVARISHEKRASMVTATAMVIRFRAGVTTPAISTVPRRSNRSSAS